MQGEGFNTEIQNDEDRRKEIFIKKVVAAHDKIATILRVNQQERDKKISEYTVSYPIFYFNVQNNNAVIVIIIDRFFICRSHEAQNIKLGKK